MINNAVELTQIGETLERISHLHYCLIEKAQSGEVEPSELTALQAAVQHVCSVVDAMWGEESDAP